MITTMIIYFLIKYIVKKTLIEIINQVKEKKHEEQLLQDELDKQAELDEKASLEEEVKGNNLDFRIGDEDTENEIDNLYMQLKSR